MTGLEVFNYSGQQVRTVVIDGEPWFAAKDACDVLGIQNARRAVTEQLDPDGVRTTYLTDSLGRQQDTYIVSEAGLYELIFQSRKPEAREFRRWVTAEVLPTIRRTGQFGSQLPTSFAEALELAAATQRAIETAEAKIEADAPKVAAYERFMDADGYLDMGSAAKILGVGRTTMFRQLREAGVLQPGSNLPYQRYAHHFKVTVGSWSSPDGDIHVTHTTRVRPAGLQFLSTKLESVRLVSVVGGRA